MAEIPPSPNRPPSSERPLPPYKPLLGLQGRLAIGGEALKPTTQAELKNGIVNPPEVAVLMTKASEKERDAHWSAQPEQTKDAQLTAWKKGVATKIALIPQSTIGRDHMDFFTKMGINPANFNEASAQTLYDKYFSKQHEQDGVNLFIADAVHAFTTAGGTDVAALKSHLTAVQWMAGMFGKNSSELVTQLLDAQVDSLSDEAAFVAARKNKVNELGDHEKELLTFLTDAETAPIQPPKKKYDGAFVIESDPIITITDEEIDKLALLNGKPELVTVGQDSEGKDLAVHMGFPDKKDAHGHVIFPSEPYVFVADNLAISDKTHNEALKNVTVIAAHGIRGADNTWRFLNQQDVYQTVLKYNEYAKKNGLPPIEFIMSCSAPNQPDKLNIISIDTGDGTIVQSDNASINVSLYRDERAGQNVATASFRDGEFIGIDDLIRRKKSPIVEPPHTENHVKDDLLCIAAGKATAAEVNMDVLALEYRNHTIETIKKMRTKTAEITLKMKQEGKPDDEIKSVIQEFLDVQILLDAKAFPPDDIVRLHVPSYVPEGMSDMGSDKETDPKKRHGREKIRVDKAKMFEKSIDTLFDIFTQEHVLTGMSPKDRELWITRAISDHIHKNIKYDYQNKLAVRMHTPGASILMGGDIKELKLGVCRHHALDSQVLLQALGVDSRILKSEFSSDGKYFGPHANNLVHIEGEWYLLDTTNPESDGQTPPHDIVYLKRLPEPDGSAPEINTNTRDYEWELDKMESNGTIKKRKYKSRNNMYTRIRDNRLNPPTSHYRS